MSQKIDLKRIDAKIQSIKREAEELKGMADQFPALYRNTARILSSVKMLELNVSNILTAEGED